MSETQRKIIEDLNRVNDELREELAKYDYENAQKDKIIAELKDALRARSTKDKVKS